MKKIYDCSTDIINILYQKDDLVVRTSSILDMNFIDKLQKENSFAVGFIQKTIWEKYVFGGERNFSVFICEKNLDPVGYFLITPGKNQGYAKGQQIAVRNDARRLDYGTALVHVIKKYVEDIGRIGVTLRCRSDLESNMFWKALGFYNYGIWKKGTINHVGMKAGKDINLWRIELNKQIQMLPFNF